MRYINVLKQCVVILLIFMINGCLFRLAPKVPSVLAGGSYTLEEFKNDTNIYKTSVGDRKKLRDKIVFSVASEIDKNYMKFRNSLFGGVAAGQTSIQMAQLGLTSAATLAGGESAKAILSAIATGVSGSALSVGKNIFKEKSSDLLISRMDALRRDKWAQIYTKIITDDNTYSWYEAERDLVEYFWAGSVQAAIQSIFIESGAKADKANEEIRNRIREKFGPFLTGNPASQNELQEITQLFDGLQAMKEPDREERAKKIFDKFKEKQPSNFPINPSQPNATNLEKVKFIYRFAIQQGYQQVREILTKALKETLSSE